MIYYDGHYEYIILVYRRVALVSRLFGVLPSSGDGRRGVLLAVFADGLEFTDGRDDINYKQSFRRNDV